MSDITELERRITAALDRIGQGMDGLAAQASAAPAVDPKLQAALDQAEARARDLERALEDEKLVSAQLEERLKSVREKADRQQSAMEIQVFEQQKTTSKLDLDLQRLRRASEDLRASNVELRAALEEGLSEPHLLNKAMLGELEILRAARSVEAAQADAILSVLDPLVKRAAKEAAQQKEAEADAPAQDADVKEEQSNA